MEIVCTWVASFQGIERQFITCTSVREKCSVFTCRSSSFGLCLGVWCRVSRWPRSGVLGVGRGWDTLFVWIGLWIQRDYCIRFGSLTALTVCVFVSVLERECVTDYLWDKKAKETWWRLNCADSKQQIKLKILKKSRAVSMAAGVKHVIDVTWQSFDVYFYSHFAFFEFIIGIYATRN